MQTVGVTHNYWKSPLPAAWTWHRICKIANRRGSKFVQIVPERVQRLPNEFPAKLTMMELLNCLVSSEVIAAVVHAKNRPQIHLWFSPGLWPSARCIRSTTQQRILALPRCFFTFGVWMISTSRSHRCPSKMAGEGSGWGISDTLGTMEAGGVDCKEEAGAEIFFLLLSFHKNLVERVWTGRNVLGELYTQLLF